LEKIFVRNISENLKLFVSKTESESAQTARFLVSTKIMISEWNLRW